jgi:hypothetical protein
LADSAHGLLVLAFHPDGSLIVGADYPNSLTVWSTQDGAVVRKMTLPSGSARALSFNPSGSVLVACTGSRVFWFRTHDWSRDTVATEMAGRHPHDFRLMWVAGSVELLNFRGTWDESYIGTFPRADLGARRGMADPLGYAPIAMRASLVLAQNGEVYELDSGRRVAPPNGRRYAEMARQFAINERWLQLEDKLVDLAVDRPLLQSAGGRSIGSGGIGWAWALRHWADWGGYLDDSYKFWLLPDQPDSIRRDELAIWAQVLACGELTGDGRFRAFDEAEWESRRSRLAEARSRRQFELPGFDVNDRLYWLRNRATQAETLLDRLIAAEPTFRNFLLRATYRAKNGDHIGSLADQLEAGKLAPTGLAEIMHKTTVEGQIAYLTHFGLGPVDLRAYHLAYEADRPNRDYQILLEWAELRIAAVRFTSFEDLRYHSLEAIRGMALYRLGRFAEAEKQLEPFQIGEEGENATEVLFRAMARQRLGQTDAAQTDYKAAKAAIKEWGDRESLRAEAERLLGP